MAATVLGERLWLLWRVLIAAGSGRRRGSALLMVLVMGVVVTSLVFVAMRGLSAATRAAMVFGDEVRVEELGWSGIDLALAQISRLAGHATEIASFEMQLSTGSVAVEIVPETGRVDINHAPVAVLALVLAAAGDDAGTAGRLATQIVDWRDPAADHRAGATSDNPARSPGLPPLGKRPFAHPDELALVSGMTPERLGTLLPLVTTCSGLEAIDPLTADRNMLTRLLDGDAHKVDAFLEDRRRGFARPDEVTGAFPDHVRAALSAPPATADGRVRGTSSVLQRPMAGVGLRITARSGALTRHYVASLCPGGDNRGQEDMHLVSWQAL